MKDGGEKGKRQKGTHQDKGALGGSGLSRGSGGDLSPVNMLELLLVPVQEEDHGATAPDCERTK